MGPGLATYAGDVSDLRLPEFRAGQRVRVRRDRDYGPGPWPAEPTGTVARHPASPDGTPWVSTQTTTGLRRSYWIVFDEPQFDVERDGPYLSSEVLDQYIERVDAD
jgi:hypothetical protein